MPLHTNQSLPPAHHVSLQVAPTILNHVVHIGRRMKKCCIVVAKYLCKVYRKNLQTPSVGRWSCTGGFCTIIGVDLSVCLADTFLLINLSLQPTISHTLCVAASVGFPSLKTSPFCQILLSGGWSYVGRGICGP